MRHTFKRLHWPTASQRFTPARVLRGIPVIILGFILNLLDLVSTGMLVFPTGPNSGFMSVLPAGMAIYLTSIITGQLVLTLQVSSFPGAVGSMLVEVLPLLREIAAGVRDAAGQDSASLVPTTLVAYALCSLLMGTVFLVLGIFKFGFVIGYFPSTVLNGIIGSIGINLIIISLELTLPESSPELNLANAGGILFNARQILLVFATIGPALLLSVSTRQEIFAKLTHGITRHPLYIHGFMIMLAALFWAGAAAAGRANPNGLKSLANDGWLFPMPERSNIAFPEVIASMDYWSLFDFSKVQWSALGGAAKNIALVVVLGVLNLPIAIASLKQSLAGSSPDVNRELLGSAAGIILAGSIGTVPNLIDKVFSYSKLFTEARGGRWESFIVTILTASLLLLSPMILPYLPTILASVLVLYLGIDLTLEATWEASKILHWTEFVVVLGTLLASAFLGFAIGLGSGLALAMVVQNILSASDSMETFAATHEGGVRTTSKGIATTSSDTLPLLICDKANGYPDVLVNMRTVGSGPAPRVEVIQLSGHAFFATIPSLEQAFARNEESAPLIIDMTNVTRVETSVAQFLEQKRRELSNHEGGCPVVLAGVNRNSGVYSDLTRAGANCVFTYELNDGGEPTNDGEYFATFSTLRQSFAWCSARDRGPPVSDQDILRGFQRELELADLYDLLLSDSDPEILRSKRGSVVPCNDADPALYFVVHGCVCLESRAANRINSTKPVFRNSVATAIVGIIKKIIGRVLRSSVKAPDEEHLMNVDHPKDLKVAKRLLLPGDSLIVLKHS